MNLKEKIGQRIRQERNAKGLTRKALAALTDNLNISRINNYERGERTPGPEEIKQLAKVLEVSPAFLMGLSDDREGKLNRTHGLGALLPILNYKQACDPLYHINLMKNEQNMERFDIFPISPELAAHLNENAFAIKIKDASMVPELKVNDIVIFDPTTKPEPSDFVAVKFNDNEEIMIRKYKPLTAFKEGQFELVALNEDWPNITINQDIKCEIIAVAINLTRHIKHFNH